MNQLGGQDGASTADSPTIRGTPKGSFTMLSRTQADQLDAEHLTEQAA